MKKTFLKILILSFVIKNKIKGKKNEKIIVFLFKNTNTEIRKI